ILCRVDDAPGHDFIDQRGLPGIVKGLAGVVERLADHLRDAVVEDDAGFSYEGKNRLHVSSSLLMAYVVSLAANWSFLGLREAASRSRVRPPLSRAFGFD